MVSSRSYAAMIEMMAAAGRAATDPPLMPVARGGGSAIDETLAALAHGMNHEVLAMAAEARKAADDLEDAFFSGTVAETTSSKSNREDR